MDHLDVIRNGLNQPHYTVIDPRKDIFAAQSKKIVYSLFPG